MLTISVLMFVRANPVLLEMEKLAAVKNERFLLLAVTAHRIIISCINTTSHTCINDDDDDDDDDDDVWLLQCELKLCLLFVVVI